MKNIQLFFVICATLCVGFFFGLYSGNYFSIFNTQDKSLKSSYEKPNTGEQITAIESGTTQESNEVGKLQYNYDYISAHDCNPGIFEFEDVYFLKHFIGASFNDVLMLQSSSSEGFVCIKLNQSVAGGKLMLLDDYGETIEVSQTTLNSDGKLVIPNFTSSVKDFYKLRHFISLEHDNNGIFEGFFFAKQVKTSKISNLGIALYRKSGVLRGYEFTNGEELLETEKSKEFAICISNDTNTQNFLNLNSPFKQGIFKEEASKTNLSNTVFGNSRFYNSYINYIYDNNLLSSISKLQNPCFSFLK